MKDLKDGVEEINVSGGGFANLLSKIPTSGGKTETEVESEEEQTEEEEEQEREEQEEQEEQERENEEEEEEEEEEQQEETDKDVNYVSTINSIFESSGLDLDEELEVDPSKDGVIAVTKALLEKKGKIAKVEAIKELEDKHPVIAPLLQHLESGATIESFQRQAELESFKEVELSDDDIDTLEYVYRASLRARGIEGEEQDELVETAKDSDKLLAKATEGKSKLILLEEKLIKEQTELEQNQAKKNREEEIRIDNEVKKALSTKTLRSYKLSDEDAKTLEKAIYEVDSKTGKTARQLAWENATIEDQMLLDFILINGFKALGLKQNTQGKTAIRIKTQADKEKDKKKPDISNSGKSGANGTGKIKFKSIKDLGINKQD